MARTHGVTKVVIEGDSILIIKATKGEGKCNWSIKIIIDEIQRMMEDYQDIHVAHIYHERNSVADDLAKAVHSVMQLVEWDDTSLLPSSTQMVMEREGTFNNDT